MTFTQLSYRTKDFINADEKVQKRPKISVKPYIHNFVSPRRNTAKIKLSLYFIGCFKLAWYYIVEKCTDAIFFYLSGILP